MNLKIKLIVRQAIIASLYVVLTIVNPFSYGNIQFRIAEVLVLLCFYRKDYMIGLIIGCFIANLFSTMVIYDITLGVFATIISVLAISFSKNIYVSAIFPIIFNGLIVGFELYLAFELPFVISALEVAFGEATVIILGVILFKLLERNSKIMFYITLDEKYN